VLTSPDIGIALVSGPTDGAGLSVCRRLVSDETSGQRRYQSRDRWPALLSPHTVKQYTVRLYRKLEARNPVEAVRHAQFLGLLR
jgi:hypothetical protein